MAKLTSKAVGKPNNEKALAGTFVGPADAVLSQDNGGGSATHDDDWGSSDARGWGAEQDDGSDSGPLDGEISNMKGCPTAASPLFLGVSEYKSTTGRGFLKIHFCAN